MAFATVCTSCETKRHGSSSEANIVEQYQNNKTADNLEGEGRMETDDGQNEK